MVHTAYVTQTYSTGQVQIRKRRLDVTLNIVRVA